MRLCVAPPPLPPSLGQSFAGGSHIDITYFLEGVPELLVRPGLACQVRSPVRVYRGGRAVSVRVAPGQCVRVCRGGRAVSVRLAPGQCMQVCA